MRHFAFRPGMKNHLPLSILTVGLALLFMAVVVQGQYTMTWSCLTQGGGCSTDGRYVLIGGIGCSGQSDLEMTATDVRFTLRHLGNGQVQIGYSTINGDAPRTVALQVNLGSATIQSSSDVVSKDPAFDGFMDYAYTNPTGYTLGTGHPLANPSGPGVPSFGAGISQFALNLAHFDETGNQTPGPISSTNLVTLQLHGSGSTTVTISADAARGCSFAERGQTMNLPKQLNVTLP